MFPRVRMSFQPLRNHLDTFSDPQELSKQNFRFAPTSDREFRRAAITRARVWWESEGVGFHGLGGAEIQQRGRIR